MSVNIVPIGALFDGTVVLTAGSFTFTGTYDFSGATVTGIAGVTTPGLPDVVAVNAIGDGILGTTADGPGAGPLFMNVDGKFFNSDGYASQAAIAYRTGQASFEDFFTSLTKFSFADDQGTSGQVLTSQGSSALPHWTTPSGSGTVTSITVTVPTGLSVSPATITSSGTFAITTTLNGVLKGNGSGIVAATSGTDYLTPTGSGAGLSGIVLPTRTINGHVLSADVTVTKSDLSLGSVENTALSTWAGSANLTTLGTIGTGIWHGTAIGDTYISSASTWNAKQSALTFSTGLTNTTGTVTVNASQVITTISNLTSNGFVKTSGATGALSIDSSTYLTANQTITLTGNVTGSGTTSITTTIAAGVVTNAMLAGSITAANLVGSDITTLGTITTGTWHGTLIGGTYGGTGVNNGAASIAIGGSVVFSGGFTFTATLTATTAVTFPTSGTLLTTAGSGASLTGIDAAQVSNTINAQTGTTYTAQAGDNGKIVTLSNASAITVTLPNSLVAGWACTFEQLGAGQVTFSAGSGATLQNRQGQSKTAGQYALCFAYVRTNSGTNAVYNLGGDTA